MNTHKTGLAHAYRRCLTGDIANGNLAAHWIAKPIWSGVIWTPQPSAKPIKKYSRQLPAHA